MPVESTKAMPSSASRSAVRGRPVRPCTAGRWGGISGSISAHSSSLISRGGGEDAGDDMADSLRRSLAGRQSPKTYFRNVFLEVVSQRRGQLSVADQGASQLEQAEVDVGAVLIPGAQPLEGVQPGEASFDVRSAPLPERAR